MMLKHSITGIFIPILLAGSIVKSQTTDVNSPPEEEIVQIKYEHHGGRILLSETLVIAPYLILYSYSSGLSSDTPRRMDEPIESRTWQKLLSELDIVAFKLLEGLDTAGKFGIPDKKITITIADGKEYSTTNPIKNEYYSKLVAFFDQLDSIRNEYNKNSLP